MRAGRTEAGEIDRLAPRELGAHMRDPRIGEFRAELVKSRCPHGFRRQPARDTEADAGEPGMPRSNSYLWFQPVQPLGLARTVMTRTRINHNWRRATMPFRHTE